MTANDLDALATLTILTDIAVLHDASLMRYTKDTVTVRYSGAKKSLYLKTIMD